MVAIDPHVFSLNGLHPEYLTSAIHGAELKTCQLTKAPLLSTISRVVCSDVTLDLLSIGPALMTNGAMPKGHFTMIFVDRCPGMGRSFNFSTEHNADIMGFYPPGSDLGNYSPPGLRNLVLSVRSEKFLDTLDERMPDFPLDILKKGAAIHVGIEEQKAIRFLTRQVEESITDPEQPLSNETARKQLQCDLLDVYMAALRNAYSRVVPAPGIRVAKRYGNFQRLSDYMAGHTSGMIYVPDLARELGMTERTIENLFHDFLGIAPSTYLKCQRLYGVRCALAMSEMAAGVVKKHALDWGFWHLGHFARDYRLFFGESPSETLARPPRRERHLA